MQFFETSYKETMEGYKTHLFICTNAPDKSGKCGSKGAEELRKEVKEQCKKEFGKSVRVNSAGCLGYCERGIAAVIYPQGEWLFELDKKDSDKVVKRVKKNYDKD